MVEGVFSPNWPLLWGHILELYHHRVSTGPVRGTINRIRTMQRQANAFQDREFFLLGRAVVST